MNSNVESHLSQQDDQPRTLSEERELLMRRIAEYQRLMKEDPVKARLLSIQWSMEDEEPMEFADNSSVSRHTVTD